MKQNHFIASQVFGALAIFVFICALTLLISLSGFYFSYARHFGVPPALPFYDIAVLLAKLVAIEVLLWFGYALFKSSAPKKK